jgi:hypothetical protein
LIALFAVLLAALFVALLAALFALLDWQHSLQKGGGAFCCIFGSTFWCILSSIMGTGAWTIEENVALFATIEQHF